MLTSQSTKNYTLSKNINLTVTMMNSVFKNQVAVEYFSEAVMRKFNAKIPVIITFVPCGF
jgi:hypothetical protein